MISLRLNVTMINVTKCSKLGAGRESMVNKLEYGRVHVVLTRETKE